MNKPILKLTVGIVSILLICSLSFLTTTTSAQDDHGGHMGMEDQCQDATETVAIATEATALAFNVTEVEVTPGACVQFHFMNTQTVEHDFVVYNDEGHEMFGLHLNTTGMMMLKYPMPEDTTTLEFWCTVVGHKDAGMYGTIQVGNSSFLPGFGFLPAISAIIAVAIPLIAIRRKTSK